MSLKLHDKAKQSVVQFLVEKLPLVQVNNGCFLDFDSSFELFGVDGRLSNSKNLSAKLEEYIGDEQPLFHFITETISSDIREFQYETDAKCSLVECDLSDNLEAYAASIVERFDSLPWQYSFSFTVPASLSSMLPNNVNEIRLGPKVRLMRVNDEFREEFAEPPSKGMGMLSNPFANALKIGGGYPSWSDGAVVFQTEEGGFVGRYDASAPIRRGESMVRSFFGLLFATHSIELNNSYSFSPPKRPILVHRMVDQQCQPHRRHDLGDDVDAMFARIEINSFGGKVRDDAGKAQWLRSNLKAVVPAFSAPQSGRIMLAARWLFDSHANKDSLLAFVQAMVCLEILLGVTDKRDPLGLGATIRNRCTYLIATSYEQREKLSDDLRAIYEVRSNILHNGKDRLTGEEHRMLALLRWIVGRVIRKELELLKAQDS